MDQSIAFAQGASQILRLPQITRNDLGIQALQNLEFAGLTSQQTQLRAFSRILLGHMRSYKACRSSDEYAHVMSFP
jgi:hypothetical protein